MRKLETLLYSFCMAILLCTPFQLSADSGHLINVISEDGSSLEIAIVCDNITEGGLIEGNESACAAPTFDPSLITSISPASGGSGDIEYLWIYTTDDPTGQFTSWINIPNSNTETLDPLPISQTTWYRRCARRSECTDYEGESNYIIKEINCCDNVTDGGLIVGNQEGCGPEYDASAILNDLTPSGGSGVYEYVWHSSTTSNVYTAGSTDWTIVANADGDSYIPNALSQTSHFIRTVRRNGCDEYIGESNVITITVNESPALSAVIVNNINCFGDENGAVDLTITGGLMPYEAYWNGSTVNEANPTNLVAGENTVIVTGANGCSSSLTVAFDSPNLLEIDPWLSNPSCGNANGTIELNLGGANGGLVFTWSDPQYNGQSVVNGLAPGSYTATITDANGCFATETFILENDTNGFGVSLDSTNPSCANADNGTITANVSGGLMPYTYIWNDDISSTTPTIENLSTGTYTVLITDANGCTITETTTLTTSEAMILSFETTVADCGGTENGSATVFVENGQAPWTYVWNDANNTESPVLENISIGNYQVTVTDALGCTMTATATVSSPPSMSVIFNVENATCQGISDGSITANVSGGEPAYTYLWSDANSQNTATATGLAAGQYTVTINDAAGCMTIEGIEVLNALQFELETSIIQHPSCNGASDGQATVSALNGTPDFTYNWSDANSQSTATATGLSSGVYSVTVSDMIGCSAVSGIEILESTTITYDVTSEPETCEGSANGSAMVIEIFGGTAPYNYLWDDANAQTTAIATNLPSGTYSVLMTDANGCSASTSIEITAPATLALDIDSFEPICSDDSNGTISITSSGGTAPYTYLWSTGNETNAISNLTTGAYSVTVNDANGCAITEAITLGFTSTLSASIISSAPSCFDGNDGSAQLVVTGGSTPYLTNWSNGTSGLTANNLTEGVYSVSLTDGDGCEDSFSFEIEDPEALTCEAFVSMQISDTGGSDGGISVNANGGTGAYSYNWNTGNNTQNINDLAPGIYGVTVSDANDCNCIASVQLFDPGKLGNFVWWDINENGLQDIGEEGIGNVTVNLAGTSSFGQTITTSTTTDATGMYMFTSLPVGSYTVTFEAPDMYEFTQGDVGNNEAIDSDANSTTGQATTVYLPEGAYNQDIDAGFTIATVDIGNYVWFDTNRNGLQDGFESGVNNYLVQLYDADDNTMQGNTFTNSQGFYLFENVLPGNYYIQFSTVSLPNGFVYTAQNEGNDDTLDSDAGLNGQTDIFTIVLNQADNLTFDAGIYETCDNVTNGGQIQGNEELCGIGSDPSEITNVLFPVGGQGGLEYLWIESNTPIYNGLGDPNWTIIADSNSPSYDPGPIFSTTYFIRCARRDGCTEFIGETNTIEKLIKPFPLTNIQEMPSSPCPGDLNTFEATNAGAGATYAWTFDGASPSSSNTRVANNISWNTMGEYQVTLTVTHNGCTLTTSVPVNIDDCFGGGTVINLTANPMNDEAVQLKWQSYNNNDYQVFFVQSSVDALNFEDVEMISATESQGIQTYETMDYQPSAGANFYRIRILNVITGSIVISDHVKAEIKSNNNNAIVSIYPNPIIDKVNIRLLTNSSENVTVRLVDAFGKTQQTLVIPENQLTAELNTTNLPNGIYFLQIKQANHKTQVQKLIKQN